LEPQSVTAGRRAKFTVVAENRGNVPLEMSLSATDAEKALRCRFAASEITVPPGRRVRAAMLAKGKRPFLRAPLPRILTVASVAAKGKDGEAATTTLASGDVGAFTLSGLKSPDTYLVTVTMEGFATQTALVPVSEDGAVVQVGILALGRGSGSITGTITGEGSGPLGGVQVTVTKDGDPVARSVTDSEGSVGFYSLGGLVPPGPYLVTFERIGFVSKSVEVSVATDAPSPVDAALG